ncbi:MAG TPA: hypothetical protein VIM41_17140 [Gammaproteobacteria bacterium]
MTVSIALYPDRNYFGAGSMQSTDGANNSTDDESQNHRFEQHANH